MALRVEMRVTRKIKSIQRGVSQKSKSLRYFVAGKLARDENYDPDFYRKNSPLLCVISGMEHSGTTFLSQLLNGHPRIASGVECGLLLSAPHDFHAVQPFYDWLVGEEGWGWCLTPADRQRILVCRDHYEAYWVLSAFKGRAQRDDRLRRIFLESDLIFDKTPRYIYNLDKIMEKVNSPFLVTVKTPAEQYVSAKKRGVTDVDAFLMRYEKAMSAVKRALHHYPDRLMVIEYKRLVTDTPIVMQQVAEFIGMKEASYFCLEKYNERFGNLIQIKNSFDNSKAHYHPPEDQLTKQELSKLNKVHAYEA